MPSALGVVKNTGKRYNPLNRELVKRFRKETGTYIKYEDFLKIVQETNLLMQEAVSEEAGLKLPYRLGHIVVTKYKSNKQPKDWKNTQALGKAIPELNLHSFGYIYHIKWFKMGCNFRHHFIYKFLPLRPLKRKVAANIKSGKLYHQWENTDFWSTTSMERTYDKFYNKNDNP